VGPEIAEFLDLPQVTYVKRVKNKGNKLEVVRFTEYGEYMLEVNKPVLLTAIKELNTPRYPSIKGIIEAYGENGEEKIKLFTLNDLDVDTTQIGLKGSPTNVYKSFVPVKDKQSEMIKGDNSKEKASKLIMRLSELNLV
jgi:electron transfer flavoprotein beta subunit